MSKSYPNHVAINVLAYIIDSPVFIFVIYTLLPAPPVLSYAPGVVGNVPGKVSVLPTTINSPLYISIANPTLVPDPPKNVLARSVVRVLSSLLITVFIDAVNPVSYAPTVVGYVAV